MNDPDVQDRRIDTLEREMHDVNKTLYKGNGQPPLVATVAEIRKAQSTQTWLLRTTLAVVVGDFLQRFLA